MEKSAVAIVGLTIPDGTFGFFATGGEFNKGTPLSGRSTLVDVEV
jgi:hypothetical protein